MRMIKGSRRKTETSQECDCLDEGGWSTVLRQAGRHTRVRRTRVAGGDDSSEAEGLECVDDRVPHTSAPHHIRNDGDGADQWGWGRGRHPGRHYCGSLRAAEGAACMSPPMQPVVVRRTVARLRGCGRRPTTVGIRLGALVGPCERNDNVKLVM